MKIISLLIYSVPMFLAVYNLCQKINLHSITAFVLVFSVPLMNYFFSSLKKIERKPTPYSKMTESDKILYRSIGLTSAAGAQKRVSDSGRVYWVSNMLEDAHFQEYEKHEK